MRFCFSSKDKILGYIDEQICSRLTGSAKKTCQQIIEKNGRELLSDIECGTVTIEIIGKINFDQNISSRNLCFSVLDFKFVLIKFFLRQVQSPK